MKAIDRLFSGAAREDNPGNIFRHTSAVAHASFDGIFLNMQISASGNMAEPTVGTFILSDWLFGDGLNGRLCAFRADGQKLLEREFSPPPRRFDFIYHYGDYIYEYRTIRPGDRPLTVARVAGVERMQMMVESAARPALQRFLASWVPALHELRRRPEHKVLRWAIDVDPLSI